MKKTKAKDVQKIWKKGKIADCKEHEKSKQRKIQTSEEKAQRQQYQKSEKQNKPQWPATIFFLRKQQRRIELRTREQNGRNELKLKQGKKSRVRSQREKRMKAAAAAAAAAARFFFLIKCGFSSCLFLVWFMSSFVSSDSSSSGFCIFLSSLICFANFPRFLLFCLFLLMVKIANAHLFLNNLKMPHRMISFWMKIGDVESVISWSLIILHEVGSSFLCFLSRLPLFVHSHYLHLHHHHHLLLLLLLLNCWCFLDVSVPLFMLFSTVIAVFLFHHRNFFFSVFVCTVSFRSLDTVFSSSTCARAETTSTRFGLVCWIILCGMQFSVLLQKCWIKLANWPNFLETWLSIAIPLWAI